MWIVQPRYVADQHSHLNGNLWHRLSKGFQQQRTLYANFLFWIDCTVWQTILLLFFVSLLAGEGERTANPAITAMLTLGHSFANIWWCHFSGKPWPSNAHSSQHFDGRTWFASELCKIRAPLPIRSIWLRQISGDLDFGCTNIAMPQKPCIVANSRQRHPFRSIVFSILISADACESYTSGENQLCYCSLAIDWCIGALRLDKSYRILQSIYTQTRIKFKLCVT